MFLLSCSSETITEESLIKKNDGLKYIKNAEKPYTGPVNGVNINGDYYTGNYRHGVRHGDWKSFHHNGLEKIVSYYSNGSLNGSFLIYHENGSKSVVTNYKYGNENGNRLEYNNMGELIKEKCYEIGKIVDCKSLTSIKESKIEAKENDFKKIVYTGNIFEASYSDLLSTVFNTEVIKNSIEWKSNTSIENEFYPNSSRLITTRIIAKEKIGNELLVLFSSTEKGFDCHICNGAISVLLFSMNNEELWEITYIDNFDVGGSWGSNASIELIRNEEKQIPLFLFRFTDGGQGWYKDIISIIGFINGRVKNVFDSSEEEYLSINENNSGQCCLGLHDKVMMTFDNIPFEEALSTMINIYGKGYQFSWNDSIYNTYTEEDGPKDIDEYCGEDAYSSYACFSTKSSYRFIPNPNNYIDDLQINVEGTKERSIIFDNYDLVGESFPIYETHYYHFSEDSLKYVLNTELSNSKYFDGNKWVIY